MAKQAGFGKMEKLKSRKLIEELFARGKSISVFPIRILYIFSALRTDEKPLLQVGVSVIKRNFKRAVDRNGIKRLLREAYRLQKKELLELMTEQKKKGFVFFIYTDKQLPEYRMVFDTMTKCLSALKRKVVLNEDRS
jgi:ribonuclease P protein component